MEKNTAEKRAYVAPRIHSGEAYERLALACTGAQSRGPGDVCTKAQHTRQTAECDAGCSGS